ncbi:MAG: site-specific integrase, partial [Nitratireductor sp.]
MKSQYRIEAFLEMLAAERGASANTLAAYRRDLTALQGFLAAKGKTLTDLSAPLLRQWQASMAAEGLAPSTI